jgi:hypothetical protein
MNRSGFKTGTKVNIKLRFREEFITGIAIVVADDHLVRAHEEEVVKVNMIESSDNWPKFKDKGYFFARHATLFAPPCPFSKEVHNE